MHVQANLVDEIRREERPREITTAHHANPLPLPCFDVTNYARRVVAHELDAVRRQGIQRSREDERPHSQRGPAAAPAHSHRLLPGLPPHQNRVDRLPVVAHDLADVLAEVQPVDLAIPPGNESVERTCCSQPIAPRPGSVRASSPSPRSPPRRASPAALARNLAYLQIDLTDPDFRKHLLAQARATRVALREVVDEAVAAGELASGVDSEALARVVETTLSGSLITWAIYRDGDAAPWLRADVDAVLAPHLPRRRRR